RSWGLWETGVYERRPISEVFESLNVQCRRSMVIDGVASGVKRLSGGVTSSRRGVGCQS
ncbi:hypothetical protein TNCV_4254901, partial [Trichonephila clavipes]